VGAEILPEGGVHFRVWAPRRKRVEVVLEDGPGAVPGSTGPAVELEPEAGGYFAGRVTGAGDGTLYRFRLDGEEKLLPDPASRFQPEGPHGPSEVIDPGKFRWTDQAWRGISIEGQVLYEMHIGTFTREGTLARASEELPELASAGITAIEIMPVAEFPGSFGWGYDGVDLFAPTRNYGRPVRERGACRRRWRDPRRRLQPPRPGRRLPRRVLGRLFQLQV
jgi:maltooligosyltrehalose trehalohydrolase